MTEPDSPKPPPVLGARRRLPFEEGAASPLGGAMMRRSGLLLLSILAVACAGLAAYMAFVDRHPLNSVYVIAPAVGAIWFALRVFMMLTPKR